MVLSKQKFTNFRNKYIGDKEFYKMVLGISVPMMVQNGITNLVTLLDNIMVGRLGTEAMSGVSIVNQFIFIFNLLIFGSVAAAGIYISQFYGSNDTNGLRYSFRFKFLITVSAAMIGTIVLGILHSEFINLFLHDSASDLNLEVTFDLAKEYLFIMLIGLIPHAVSQVYASTLRETGEVVVPMVSSVVAVLTNFVFNILLIFGYLGFPAMGVVGAAIATVLSRFVELFILIIYAHTHKKRFAYLKGAFRSFRIPKNLFKEILIKGIPLLLNEFFWGLAMTMRNHCYSTRGLDVVAALNISTTIFNLFSVVYMAIGSSVAIIIGRLLGAGKIEKAKDSDRKLITFSVFTGIILAITMVIASLFFPKVYNTTEEVQSLASYMMIVSGITMPFAAFANSAYFTLRSGGKVLITLLFDSVYMWTVIMPISMILAYLTNVNIFILFMVCQWADVFKSIFGTYLLKRGSWANVLVKDEKLKT